MRNIRNSYGHYFSKVQSYRKIREHEIHELYKRKTKEEAVKEIVERNMQFLLFLIQKYQYRALKYGIDFMDLVAVANLALLKATHKYNPLLGSYYKYVCSYVLSYLECELYKQTNYSRLYAKQRLQMGLDINPTDSFEKVVFDNGEDDPLTLGEIVAHPKDRQVMLILDARDLLERLQEAGKQIHPWAALILKKRFGIDGYEAMPLHKIALELKMSKEGVRKIEKKALAYLSSIVK